VFGMKKSVEFDFNGKGEYLVGYLDILGFKHHLDNHGVIKIHNSLKLILSDLISVLETGEANDSFFFNV
jgi:hypothetical protein